MDRTRCPGAAILEDMEFVIPDVDYRATSLRPSWPDLPAAVRDMIEARLGSVTAVSVPGSGFTPAFAATVTGTHGTRFLKAAPTESRFGQAAAREARVLAAVPDGLPVSSLCWADHSDGWIVLCLNVIDGHMPGHPLDTADASAVLRNEADVAHSLASPPAALTEAVADKQFSEFADRSLSTWRGIAGGKSLHRPLSGLDYPAVAGAGGPGRTVV